MAENLTSSSSSPQNPLPMQQNPAKTEPSSDPQQLKPPSPSLEHQPQLVQQPLQAQQQLQQLQQQLQQLQQQLQLLQQQNGGDGLGRQQQQQNGNVSISNGQQQQIGQQSQLHQQTGLQNLLLQNQFLKQQQQQFQQLLHGRQLQTSGKMGQMNLGGLNTAQQQNGNKTNIGQQLPQIWQQGQLSQQMGQQNQISQQQMAQLRSSFLSLPPQKVSLMQGSQSNLSNFAGQSLQSKGGIEQNASYLTATQNPLPMQQNPAKTEPSSDPQQLKSPSPSLEHQPQLVQQPLQPQQQQLQQQLQQLQQQLQLLQQHNGGDGLGRQQQQQNGNVSISNGTQQQISQQSQLHQQTGQRNLLLQNQVLKNQVQQQQQQLQQLRQLQTSGKMGQMNLGGLNTAQQQNGNKTNIGQQLPQIWQQGQLSQQMGQQNQISQQQIAQLRNPFLTLPQQKVSLMQGSQSNLSNFAGQSLQAKGGIEQNASYLTATQGQNNTGTSSTFAQIPGPAQSAQPGVLNNALSQQQQQMLRKQQQQQMQQLASSQRQKQQQQLKQQQSPKMVGDEDHKVICVTGSQPGRSSSQGTEVINQILGNRKILLAIIAALVLLWCVTHISVMLIVVS